MPPIDPLLLFILFSAGLALSPGPDNLFVMSHAMVKGYGSAMWVVAGLCTGLAVHSLLLAVGVSALITASPLAFAVLKGIGAAYLLYLGILAWRSAGQIPARGAEPSPASGLYRRGIAMNLMNPKVAVFFLAFLPQFADPERGSLAAQLLILGAVFALTSFAVFGGLAWLAHQWGRFLFRSDRMYVWAHRATALLLVGLAVRLLL